MSHTEPHAIAIPPHRRRLYAAIVVLFPLLLLVLLELLLRVSGYGSDPVFFAEQNIEGREYLRLNANIAERYFPRMDLQPAASSDVFLKHKEEGTLRVFFLGASSMLGYPYMFNASISAIIRDALRRDYPDRSFEIVNLSMTAVTSQFVRDYGEACLTYEPDLIVVYAGHNEYYGGMGVASTASLGPPWMTRLYLDIQHFRLIQVLAAMLQAIFVNIQSEQAVSGTLMEALAGEKEIRFGSELFYDGVNTFHHNMTSMVDDARDAGVPVLFATLVSNLRDLPPFRSVPREDDTFNPQAEIDSLLEVIEMLRPDQTDRYRTLVSQVYALDTLYAASVYALGREQEHRETYDDAYVSYGRARDYDGLRFRGSTLLNDTIRAFGAIEGVTVVDTDSLIRRVAKHGIPGRDLLHEHVHPTIIGYEHLASILYPEVREILELPESQAKSLDRLSASVTPIDTIAAQMRLGILLQSWPFTDTRRSLSDITPKGWEEDIAFAYLDGSYTWEQMHVLVAERYEAEGRLDDAIREYRALMAATPFNVSPYLRLGSLYLALGQRTDAQAVLESSFRIEQTSRAAMMLGQLAYEDGRYEDAVKALRRALSTGQLNDESGKDVRLSLAVALHRARRTPEARDEVRRLLSLYPDFTPAKQFEEFLGK